VTVEIKAKVGGITPGWATWGKGQVTPGQVRTLGSGSGPFFEVVGVSGGAKITHGQLNVILKIAGTSSVEFDLMEQGTSHHYMALVY
jgi:hypothetical protein